MGARRGGDSLSLSCSLSERPSGAIPIVVVRRSPIADAWIDHDHDNDNRSPATAGSLTTRPEPAFTPSRSPTLGSPVTMERQRKSGQEHPGVCDPMACLASHGRPARRTYALREQGVLHTRWDRGKSVPYSPIPPHWWGVGSGPGPPVACGRFTATVTGQLRVGDRRHRHASDGRSTKAGLPI